MAEFHGEMPSAQSKISLACHVRTVHIVSRPSAFVTIFRALLADAQRALPRLSGENQQGYPLVELLTALAFLLASLVWQKVDGGWR